MIFRFPIILTIFILGFGCSRSSFDSSKPTEVNTLSSTRFCEEIAETNGFLHWCNQNELTPSEVTQVCYGIAYISGKYRKILKLESNGQDSKCYAESKGDKNIFIPECDSAAAQSYNSLKGEETLSVFECQQNQSGIFYIHAAKNKQKLFTVFSK
jgi:hypothetical protein